MKIGRQLVGPILALSLLLGWCSRAAALDPSLDVAQYSHTAFTLRDGFPVGNVFSIAQTTDGYLWFGGEFGIFRFDGVGVTPWQPPGLRLDEKYPFRLLGARDGTLWIGTFESLLTWDGSKLTRHPEFEHHVIGDLLEDREGYVWAGTWDNNVLQNRLCAMRGGDTRCYGDDGKFGKTIGAVYEDSSGVVWASAETGLWRCKPGPPTRVSTESIHGEGMSQSPDGQTIVANYGKDVMQVAGDKLRPFSIRDPNHAGHALSAREVDANKLLRDRDGGLWIGTVERGLIHVHHGRTDVFRKADGLSSDIILNLFEDREGNIWVSTNGGIDRFRELPVSTMTVKQGLSSDNTDSVLASSDGTVWIATHDGLTIWKNGQATTLRKANGLPDDRVQSLYQDGRGRIWAFTDRGLAYSEGGRFVAVNAPIPSSEVYSITGDKTGNLWLSGNKGLSHLLGTHLIETLPWSALGRSQQAKVLVADNGGIWLSFWTDGGVEYFKDGRVQQSYKPADGLGKGHVPGLRVDRDGAIWAATQDGGLSRIKDGHLHTLSTANGLPCDNILWSMEDDERSLWMYTGCGLVRISPAEVNAWIADPQHTVQVALWGAADGVRLRNYAVSSYGPTAAKSKDGKLWSLVGEGVEVIDPNRLLTNPLQPPVHIETILADGKVYWQNLPGAAASTIRLPARTHDLQIFYTALSLVAPEKVHFKYTLEGQDDEWREVVNDRDVQYSNVAPGTHRFRVIACNNSGVWNQQGDSIEFTVDPAYYQTIWFRTLCVIFGLSLIWAAYHYRVRHLRRQFEMTLDARVSERTRIARELHDTLLQSFQGVLLRLQTASQLIQMRPAEAQEKLDSTIDNVAEAIAEGRDAVQGLRDSTVQGNDLAEAISTLGEDLAANASGHRPAFREEVEGEPRNLHPILRDEVYRIAAESLRNAFQHARAQHIEVEIHYHYDQFRLRVRDDGKGMDPALVSRDGTEGHYGLPGMKERATLIGGKLTIWSELDAGTELELTIPGSLAYTASGPRSWFSRVVAGKR